MLLSEDEQVSQAYKNGPLGSVPIDWEKTPSNERSFWCDCTI